MLNKEELYRPKYEEWASELRAFDGRLLLPGIMGSELYDNVSSSNAWFRFLDTDLQWLRLQRLSESGAVDEDDRKITARGVVDPPLIARPYSAIRDALGLAVFPFDWRDSIPIEARRLGQFLDVALAEGTKKLRIVTHSMGGLVLLHLLAGTTRFDAAIESVAFCAPPFFGALRALQVIEHGNGLSALDYIIDNDGLQETAASLPGLFQLLPAPPGCWPTELPIGGGVQLQHPVRGPFRLHDGLPAWNNVSRLELRMDLLRFSRRHFERLAGDGARAARRLLDAGKNLHIVVGTNAKTYYAATRDEAVDDWNVHQGPEAPAGRHRNGDGTVLLQSSYLPGFPTDRISAFVSSDPDRTSLHSDFLDEAAVIAAVGAIFGGQGSGLVPWSSFAPEVDFTHELAVAAQPAAHEHLDHLGRDRARARLAHAQWTAALNPVGPHGADDEVFARTNDAALAVLRGRLDLPSAAARSGITEAFLKGRVRRLAMPML